MLRELMCGMNVLQQVVAKESNLYVGFSFDHLKVTRQQVGITLMQNLVVAVQMHVDLFKTVISVASIVEKRAH